MGLLLTLIYSEGNIDDVVVIFQQNKIIIIIIIMVGDQLYVDRRSGWIENCDR